MSNMIVVLAHTHTHTPVVIYILPVISTSLLLGLYLFDGIATLAHFRDPGKYHDKKVNKHSLTRGMQWGILGWDVSISTLVTPCTPAVVAVVSIITLLSVDHQSRSESQISPKPKTQSLLSQGSLTRGSCLYITTLCGNRFILVRVQNPYEHQGMNTARNEQKYHRHVWRRGKP